jgi:Chaperone of endosialidase
MQMERRNMNMKPLILIPMLFIGLGVLPEAQAVSPPPDGGYSGGNTAEGQNALFNLTTGTYNTALGLFSLRSNTTGNFNTATGAGTLLLNTADRNTATGAAALLSNTTGFVNTANGAFALYSNTDGVANTATGAAALRNNTTGNDNTANGAGALQSNAVGLDNTANGASALFSNTIGSNNTAIGATALLNNTTGGNNIALGISAGFNLTTGDSNIDIGNFGATGESATIRIGANGNQTRSFIAGIRGVMTGNGNAIPVLIDSAGQLGTTSSSRRFKDEIKPIDKASEAILALKPVTFHYKNDHTATPQFGLIAEEVADVNPDLVVRDENGEIYTVRYDAVNALLLNEFLKEHRKVEQQAYKMDAADRKIQEQEATIAELKSGMKALAATVNEQTLKLQKVSAQLELNRPAPQQVVLKIP